MALRFQSKNVPIAVAGTTFTHGLQSPIGTAVVPDEYSAVHFGAPPAPSACTIYVASVSTTTIVVASASGATTGSVFASVNHSLIK